MIGFGPTLSLDRASRQALNPVVLGKIRYLKVDLPRDLAKAWHFSMVLLLMVVPSGKNRILAGKLSSTKEPKWLAGHHFQKAEVPQCYLRVPSCSQLYYYHYY